MGSPIFQLPSSIFHEMWGSRPRREDTPTSQRLSNHYFIAVSRRLCERWRMVKSEDKILPCPICDRPLSLQLSREIHARQSNAGKQRWRGVGKRKLSEEMKRVRRGEKKNGIAA